ncbi:hypothetical protein ATC03_10665 [Agromyces aureus]|uniref:Uncharacterized protein n=2 Tax=Agromyces aureus TaxID=453304 RepID=A0A191WFT7_9MICO|nr:hypothetical protein ATC03_10665 [Agromyces aureus]
MIALGSTTAAPAFAATTSTITVEGLQSKCLQVRKVYIQEKYTVGPCVYAGVRIYPNGSNPVYTFTARR